MDIRPPFAHTSSMEKTKIKLRQQGFLKDFLKCGITGWCLEIMFTSIDSILSQDWRLMGRTSILMFPIYGLGAILGPVCRWVDRWVDEGIWDLGVSLKDRLLRHGMMDMVLIFCGEYLFGLFLRGLGICPWDYSGRPTNINGLIRLDFAPLWFLTGLLFEGMSRSSPVWEKTEKIPSSHL